jgi:hypothetical protein
MLEKYPDMTIDTIEVPPNITIVFKQVKGEKALAHEKKKQQMELENQIHKKRKVNRIFYISGTAIALACAGAGAYYYDKGLDSYDKYGAESVPSQITLYRDETRKYITFSRISFGAAGASFSFAAFRLFFMTPADSKIAASVTEDGVALCLRF